MSRLVHLEVSNCKRISFAEVDLAGNLIKIGGMNEQGKSSLMDSIRYLYGGKSTMPPVTLRKGTEQGYIKGIEDNGWVTIRKFGKTDSFTVKDDKGRPQKKAQAICDEKCGAISFDPLEIARLGDSPDGRRRQGNILMKLKGLDFSELEARKVEVKEERTVVGREVKQLEGEFEGITVPKTDAKEEVSAAGLSAELTRRQEVNRDNVEKREELACIGDDWRTQKQAVKELEEQLAAAQEKLAEFEQRGKRLKVVVAELKDEDVSEIQEQLSKIDEVNAAVRERNRYADVKAKLKAKKEAYEKHTQEIEKIEAERLEQLNATPWPIDGLGIDDEGFVTYQGLPFTEEQLSSKQVARASAAIGFALAPEPENLQCMLIKNGSLFDANALAELAAEAERVGWTVLVEIVGEDGDIVIEDGAIKENDGTTPTE